MKKKEAYEALNLPEGASQEEVSKAFKKAAKMYHPDVNKEPDAEAKFKKANEAYQAINNKDFEDNRGNPFGGASASTVWDFGGINFGDLFGGFGGGNPSSGRQKFMVIEDIHLKQTISFKEAILGCKKDITYKCNVMCEKCHGSGSILLDNGCKTCNGKGRVSGNRGGMFFERTCSDCRGKTKSELCKECSSEGHVKSERTVSVSIKPGVTNNTTLRLAGMGNFNGFGLGNSTVYIVVYVTPDKNLRMEGNDVCTNLNISLVDALKGCTKSVHTIDGEQDIDIPAVSKNKNEVTIPKLGVNRQGNERVILHVDYPKDIAKLITFLEEGE